MKVSKYITIAFVICSYLGLATKVIYGSCGCANAGSAIAQTVHDCCSGSECSCCCGPSGECNCNIDSKCGDGHSHTDHVIPATQESVLTVCVAAVIAGEQVSLQDFPEDTVTSFFRQYVPPDIRDVLITVPTRRGPPCMG